MGVALCDDHTLMVLSTDAVNNSAVVASCPRTSLYTYYMKTDVNRNEKKKTKNNKQQTTKNNKQAYSLQHTCDKWRRWCGRCVRAMSFPIYKSRCSRSAPQQQHTHTINNNTHTINNNTTHNSRRDVLCTCQTSQWRPNERCRARWRTRRAVVQRRPRTTGCWTCWTPHSAGPPVPRSLSPAVRWPRASFRCAAVCWPRATSVVRCSAAVWCRCC